MSDTMITFDTWPPPHGRYKIERAITFTSRIRRDRQRKLVPQCYFEVRLSGSAVGREALCTTVSVSSLDAYEARLDVTRRKRSEYESEIYGTPTDAELLQRSTLIVERLRQAEIEREEFTQRIGARSRQDVRAVLDRCGGVDQCATSHYKQYQWVAS